LTLVNEAPCSAWPNGICLSLIPAAEMPCQEVALLKELNRNQAQFVAVLARAARMQRDAFVAGVPEGDLADMRPSRGEHNPMADLGFTPFPGDAPQLVILREAINILSQAGRSELYALMRIGQGALAARKWHRGLVEAQNLGDETVKAALIEDPDLHDHLVKGLYETKLAS
jgi:hypothetical protein